MNEPIKMRLWSKGENADYVRAVKIDQLLTDEWLPVEIVPHDAPAEQPRRFRYAKQHESPKQLRYMEFDSRNAGQMLYVHEHGAEWHHCPEEYWQKWLAEGRWIEQPPGTDWSKELPAPQCAPVKYRWFRVRRDGSVIKVAEWEWQDYVGDDDFEELPAQPAVTEQPRKRTGVARDSASGTKYRVGWDNERQEWKDDDGDYWPVVTEDPAPPVGAEPSGINPNPQPHDFGEGLSATVICNLLADEGLVSRRTILAVDPIRLLRGVVERRQNAPLAPQIRRERIDGRCEANRIEGSRTVAHQPHPAGSAAMKARLTDERLYELTETPSMPSVVIIMAMARELTESRRILTAILNESGAARYYAEREANRQAARKLLGEIE